MEQKAQELFIVIAVVGVTLILYMLYRPKRKITHLKFRESLRQTEGQRKISGQSEGDVRELNVIFQYNGHDFDAYEVLGVPAGAGRNQVEESFQAALLKHEKESHDMLEMAYKAILKKMS